MDRAVFAGGTCVPASVCAAESCAVPVLSALLCYMPVPACVAGSCALCCPLTVPYLRHLLVRWITEYHLFPEFCTRLYQICFYCCVCLCACLRWPRCAHCSPVLCGQRRLSIGSLDTGLPFVVAHHRYCCWSAPAPHTMCLLCTAMHPFFSVHDSCRLFSTTVVHTLGFVFIAFTVDYALRLPAIMVDTGGLQKPDNYDAHRKSNTAAVELLDYYKILLSVGYTTFFGY